jgi:hypothetical protein
LVEDTGLYDFPDKARIVKIKVQINTTKPIKPGMFIGNTKDGIQWVDFRYENLPMFCLNCGVIGHNEDNCPDLGIHIEEGGINPRGPWLRSNSYGRRVNDKRDTRFNSNPTKSMSGGCYSPIPKAMLDMLARMKLEEDAPNTNGSPNNSSSTRESGSKQGDNTTQSPAPDKQHYAQGISSSNKLPTT